MVCWIHVMLTRHHTQHGRVNCKEVNRIVVFNLCYPCSSLFGFVSPLLPILWFSSSSFCLRLALSNFAFCVPPLGHRHFYSSLFAVYGTVLHFHTYSLAIATEVIAWQPACQGREERKTENGWEETKSWGMEGGSCRNSAFPLTTDGERKWQALVSEKISRSVIIWGWV